MPRDGCGGDRSCTFSFDEETLTGNLTEDSTWPAGDWRNSYFVSANLIPVVERANAIKLLVPEGMSMAEMALRFILKNETVSTIIPGMRKLVHVEANVACSDKGLLPEDLQEKLIPFRWDREPTWWSQ